MRIDLRTPSNSPEPAMFFLERILTAMKRFLSLSLALVFLLAIACTSGAASTLDDDPNLGVYHATTAEYSGFTVSIDEIIDEGMDIELKSNGRCDILVNGKKASGKWALSGTDLTVKGGGIEWQGTLENGVMRLQYGDDLIFNLIRSDPSSDIAANNPSHS